jgi:Zn-dependent proteases
VHLDPVGSVLVPGILALGAAAVPGAPAFLFGWARPVPYNPYNFTDQKYGEAKVAAAGPAANLLIAVVFGALLQSSATLGLPPEFVGIAYQVIAINVLLMIFNLFPIPPLDGSKILPAFLPFELRMKYQNLRNTLEYNPGMAFLVLFLLIIFVLQAPLIYLTTLLTDLLAGF